MPSSRVFHSEAYDLYLYHNDHLSPHLHYVSSEYGAVFSITTGNLIVGAVSKRKHIKEVHDWILEHQQELIDLWNSRDNNAKSNKQS